MRKNDFYVKAVWDAEAKVYFSQSDILGLHIEAPTLAAFKKVMHAQALDLVVANHISKDDMAHKRLADLIPTIYWQATEKKKAAA